MKVLFDTSVLIAAIVQAHPAHNRALPWLQSARSNKMDMMVSTHTLAELYAALTALPVSPVITPALALNLITANVEKVAHIVPLSAADYITAIRHLAEIGLSGGITYDALIFKAAMKAGADRILTLNASDFRRVWPNERIEIIVP